jgi:transposase InsO family protein
MARSTFYYHLKATKKPDKYGFLSKEISTIHEQNYGRYGYRRITTELKKRGFSINHKTVSKLMALNGLKCMVRMKKYRSYKGETGRIAPNLLLRNFSAKSSTQKWVTDVTEFSLFGNKIYLSPIMDLYNSEILSYTIFDSPCLKMVTDMLNQAFKAIPDDTGLILHSDQGWQYQHREYSQMLKKKGVIQSMSRKGNCLDNAVIENFFGLLKSELLYLRKFDSMDQFKLELNNYIHYYNNHRIKIKLNGLSPVEFRTQSIN